MMTRSYNEPDDIESFSEDPGREHHAEGTRVPEGELRTVHRRIWRGGEVVNSRIEGFPVRTRFRRSGISRRSRPPANWPTQSAAPRRRNDPLHSVRTTS